MVSSQFERKIVSSKPAQFRKLIASQAEFERLTRALGQSSDTLTRLESCFGVVVGYDQFGGEILQPPPRTYRTRPAGRREPTVDEGTFRAVNLEKMRAHYSNPLNHSAKLSFFPK